MKVKFADLVIWAESCLLDGSQLSVETKQKYCLINQSKYDSFIDGRVNQRSFIGAVNTGLEWSWSDGSPWSFENWGSEQPDGGPDDTCVVMEIEPADNAGWWNDVPCNQADSPVGYICSYLNCEYFL